MTFRVALVLAMLGLVVGISAGIAAAVAGVVERSAREELVEDVQRSRDVVREAWSSRRAIESAQSRVVAEEPRLKAVVATADISHSTVIGVAQEMNRGIGADVFFVADADGFLVADVFHPAGDGEDLRGLSVVMGALEAGQSGGVLADDGRVYRVSGQRLSFGNTHVGALVLGNAIDAAFAESVEAQTGTGLVLALDERVVATSSLYGLGEAGAEVVARTQLAETPREVALDGASFLASAFTLEERPGEEPLRAIVVASLDRALAPSRQLIELLYGLAVAALALGGLIALLLSRALSLPLDRLVAFAGRVATGDLEARAEAGGMREIRSLGSALDRMVVNLRASREALASKERMEQELAIASRLQTSLLPESLEAPGLQIAARMVTASEVGGDYYDVLPGVGRRAWLAIGDVAGHGLPAGIVMLMLRTAFAALVNRDPDARPSELIVRLNRLIYEGIQGRLKTDEHVTFTALLHDGDGGFTFSGAHEDIVIWRAESGRCERVQTSGAWLGVGESVEKMTTDAELTLAPGDTMLLMTDGIFEALREDGEILGLERVERSLEAFDVAGSTPAQVLAHVFDFVQGQAVDCPDDLTLMVVRRAPREHAEELAG